MLTIKGSLKIYLHPAKLRFRLPSILRVCSFAAHAVAPLANAKDSLKINKAISTNLYASARLASKP